MTRVRVLDGPVRHDAAIASCRNGGTAMSPSDADFDRFFLRHYDGLVRGLTVMTGSREVADDCVQEAFIRAFARWRRVRRYDNPATWVRRVAINLSRDQHRSDDRRRRREDRVPRDPAGISPGDTVIEHLHLAEVLRLLSPQQRAVAALFYVEDLSIADIAESLGVTSGAVKYHLNQARANLSALLETQEVLHG